MLDHPYPASGAHRSYGVERRGTDSAILGEDAVAEEAPVALVYNGFSHAVMLATPQDLEDFALGFTLSEGIAASARELHDIDVVEHALGCEVRMALAGERFAAMRERRRALAGRTGCAASATRASTTDRRSVPKCVSAMCRRTLMPPPSCAGRRRVRPAKHLEQVQGLVEHANVDGRAHPRHLAVEGHHDLLAAARQPGLHHHVGELEAVHAGGLSQPAHRPAQHQPEHR